jgi:hypothetical protein
MKKTLLGIVFMAGLVAVGCGKKDGAAGGDGGGGGTESSGAAVKASCETATKCIEYTKGGLGLDLMKGLCEGMKDEHYKSTWSDGKPCPHDKHMGTCVIEKEGETYYYYPNTDAESLLGYESVEEAKKDCEEEPLKGKFTAVANFKMPPMKVKGVCTSAKFKTCEEAWALHGGIMKSNCESSEGKWAEGDGKCPAEGVIGTCEADDAKIFYGVNFGYEKPAPYATVKKKAEDDCKTHGDKAKYTEAPGAADMKAAGAAAGGGGAAAPKGGLPGKPPAKPAGKK